MSAEIIQLPRSSATANRMRALLEVLKSARREASGLDLAVTLTLLDAAILEIEEACDGGQTPDANRVSGA